MPGEISAIAEQLAELVLLASCAYMAAPGTPQVSSPPAVVAEKSTGVSPEVLEFMRYPAAMQRQALSYLRQWYEGVSR